MGILKVFLALKAAEGDAKQSFARWMKGYKAQSAIQKKLWTISNPYWYTTSCKKTENVMDGSLENPGRTDGRTGLIP